jgi:hypothetical protein
VYVLPSQSKSPVYSAFSEYRPVTNRPNNSVTVGAASGSEKITRLPLGPSAFRYPTGAQLG